MMSDPTYYALNDLDKKIEPYVDFDGGVFFEAGANDGKQQSNTAYFEYHRGWTGVLVEPIPSRFLQCRANRPRSKVYWAALTSPGWADPFVELTFCNLMTVTNATETSLNQSEHVSIGTQFLTDDEKPYQFHAPARTLSSILAESQITKVDLLSLDLEGFEAPALRGLDLETVDVRYICVEAWDLSGIEAILKPRYTIVEQLSYHDYLFKKV